MMRLVGGADTSKGQVRAENQDRPLLTRWVAGVADGMGGHQGGETAAQLAVTELGGLEGPLALDDLVAAVQEANGRILEEGRDPDLRGMGTTLVAMSLLDGDEVVVVNVGDSRAYRLAGDDLEQLTEDHSLVEDLVRQGQLSPEEARTHPQRNIVTRALGIGFDLDVDVFRRPARPSDRYLLCSDGLFNEVEPSRIAAELGRWEDPGEAARELVRLANEAGARDNVTCVVVDVRDDDPAGPAPAPAATAGAAVPAAPAGAGEDPDDLGRAHRSRLRRLPWRAVPYVLAVLAIAGVAVGATLWWDRSGYFVDVVAGEVVILQGRPDGVLWLEPRVVESTGIAADDLTGASRQRLVDPPVGSLAQAQLVVQSLQVVEVPSGPDPGAAGSTSTSTPSASDPATSTPPAPSPSTPSPSTPSPTTPAATGGPPGALGGSPTTSTGP